MGPADDGNGWIRPLGTGSDRMWARTARAAQIRAKNGGGRELRRTPCGGATKHEDLRDTGRERELCGREMKQEGQGRERETGCSGPQLRREVRRWRRELGIELSRSSSSEAMGHNGRAWGGPRWAPRGPAGPRGGGETQGRRGLIWLGRAATLPTRVAPRGDGEVAELEEAKCKWRSGSGGDKWRVEAGAARKMRRRVEECPDLEGGFPFIAKMARVGVLGGFQSLGS